MDILKYMPPPIPKVWGVTIDKCITCFHSLIEGSSEIFFISFLMPLTLNSSVWLYTQALKYRSVMDIVRPIREIVRRTEETTGHSVRPK